MATPAQIEANRRNALLSTGPKTEAGKAAASRNATRHGLRAEVAVFEGEDAAEYEAFTVEVIADLKPTGIVQRLLAQRMAHQLWKLQRVPALEQTLVKDSIAHGRYMYAGGCTAAQGIAENIKWANSSLAKLQMYEMRLERNFRANMKELRELQKTRGEEEDDLTPGNPEEGGGGGSPASADDPAITSPENSAERTQFSPNDRPEQELAIQERTQCHPAIATEPSPHPLPVHHEPNETP